MLKKLLKYFQSTKKQKDLSKNLSENMPSQKDLSVLLANIANDLATNSVELDPELKRVLYENRWDLYEGTPINGDNALKAAAKEATLKEAIFDPKDEELFFTLPDRDGKEKEYCCEDTVMAKLLIDGVLFVGDFDTGPFFETNEEKDKKMTACVWVNCNDLFYWGCADAEPVLSSELGDLYKMHKADKAWGSAKWACRKRGQQPQKPIVKDMKKCGSWEPWMDELKKPLE